MANPSSTYEVQNGVHANRDVVLGNQTNITIVSQMTPFQAPPNLEQLRRDYLRHLQRTYRALDFKGIPQYEAISRELPLEDVYVPLLARPEAPGGETWERRLAGRKLDADDLPAKALAMFEKGDSRPIHIEEALAKQPRVVVLGDPGSGKSTLLKYLALRLTVEADAALPILVPLNAYARALQTHGDLNLQDYLPRYFAGLAQDVADLAPLFHAAIGNGQAIILLDGLDEIQDRRAYLVNKVQGFANDAVAKGCKVIVTSRIVGYRDAPLSSEWSLYTLLDFDNEAIAAFADRWCLAFEKSTLGDTPEAHATADIERRALLEAITANPSVTRLAANPLLLTILALIKRQGVSMPNRRVELYEIYLETLIRSWNKARALDRHPVGPELDHIEIINTLAPLALWLREENPTSGVVPEEALIQKLTDYYTGPDWGYKRGEAHKAARSFLESVHHYSNLLIERGQKQYGFLHLTFEEMLAAYGIYQRGQLDWKESLALIQRHLTDPAWRETILLAVGVWGLANKQPRVAGEVVRAILKMDCDDTDTCQNVLLAGACLEDVGETGLGRAAANEVIAALQAAAINRHLPPATQRDAGFVLGRLAESSPAFLAAIRPDLGAFIPIEAGPFLYGDDKQKRVIELPFAIAKYPVTNLQYRRFVDAGGYDQQEFWSADGWTWRTGKWDTKAPKEYRSWLDGRPPEKRSEPFYWHDRKRNNPLVPVVGVSWFEAEAYANWFTHAQADGKIYRLLTEEEWERAARGKDGREYAWGNQFKPDKLNNAEFWHYDFENMTTSAVGQFPDGSTPEGICDLNGNVWEWMNSWYESKQINRVVRGGSFDSNRRLVRSVNRYRNVPGDFDGNVGFRILSLASSGG